MLFAMVRSQKVGAENANFECYDTGRFFTVTGNMIQGYDTVKDCTESIKPLYDKYLKEEKKERPISHTTSILWYRAFIRY